MLTAVQEFCKKGKKKPLQSSLDLITYGNLEQIHSIPVFKARYIWPRKYPFRLVKSKTFDNKWFWHKSLGRADS